MGRLTKKFMLENYEHLERKEGLEMLYLFDTENGRDPDAVEIHGNVRGKLFRATGATGGYVVAWHIPDQGQTGNTHIEYLDSFDVRPTDYNLSLRIVLERLKAARQRMWDAAKERSAAVA